MHPVAATGVAETIASKVRRNRVIFSWKEFIEMTANGECAATSWTQMSLSAATLALALVGSCVALAAGDATSTLLWPIPQSVQCTDGATPVSNAFTVTSSQNNTALTSAMTRYQDLYQQLAGEAAGTEAPDASAAPLLTMVITVQDASGDLLPNTSYRWVVVGGRMPFGEVAVWGFGRSALFA